MLTIRSYGGYAILATTSLLIAQLSLLGTPQTLVAHARIALPVLGLLMHAAGIIIVLALVASVSLPAVGLTSLPLIALAAAAMMTHRLAGARARAQLAFTETLQSELAVAGVLVVAVSVLAMIQARCGVSCIPSSLPVGAEAIAYGVGALVLVVAPAVRPRRAELTARGTRALLPSVYSVGVLIILDAMLLRRLEVYFLERSPDGLEGVAVFSLATQFGAVLQLLPAALADNWQPQLAVLWRENRDQFASTFRAVEWRYVLLALATFVIGVPVGGLAILVMFTKYAPWMWTIVLITAARVFFVMTALHSSTLYALGLQRRLYVPVLAGAVIAVAANVVLTLPLGLRGAIWAYAAGQITFAVLTWWAAVRAFGRAGVQHNARPRS
jgi:hypothetical protein